jgi:hypothetical protein
MTQIIPFESSALPAHIANLFPVEKLGVDGIGGFPIISIKGKVFTIVRGDEREVVLRPGETDPAGSIDVVIVNQNPARSKVYYEGGYTEGSDAKPMCFSNDGIAPDAQAAAPQATKCAICPHNQWGSRTTENGAKGKSCSDSQRIAVAPLGLLNDPMLIRVPAASLKALDTYGQSLVKRGVPYQAVVTKIGFDYTVAHPSLTFKGIGFIDDAAAKEVFAIKDDAVVEQIIGTKPTAHSDFEQAPVQIAAPVTAPVVQAPAVQVPVTQEVHPNAHGGIPTATVSSAFSAPAPASSAFAAPVQEVAPPVAPVVQPVQAKPAAKPAPEKVVQPAAQQVVEVESSSLAGEIGALLDTLDFDDQS